LFSGTFLHSSPYFFRDPEKVWRAV
jgi:hypothetical protein